jgi:hypothetical protein
VRSVRTCHCIGIMAAYDIMVVGGGSSFIWSRGAILFGIGGKQSASVSPGIIGPGPLLSLWCKIVSSMAFFGFDFAVWCGLLMVSVLVVMLVLTS